MSIHKLSRRGARRLAIQAQLLDATPPGDLVNVVTALTFLQLDPTSAIAPSADLVAWSRLKGDYHRQDLRNALEKDRSMFEYRAMVRPMADLVNLRPLMDEWPREDRPRRWLEDNAAFRGGRPGTVAARRTAAVTRDRGHQPSALAVDGVDEQPQCDTDA